DFRVLIRGAILVEHVGGEVDALVVEADLREVGAVRRTQRHIEGVDIPGSAWIARPANPDPVRRLERAVVHAKRALDLQRGSDEATVVGVIDRARVAHERYIARAGAGVGNAEE